MAVTEPPTAISGESVEKAVKALLKWRDLDSKSQKAQLLPSDDFVYLVVTLSKIPPQSRTNPYKLPLIHPLYSPDADGSELCLFLDDRPDRLPTSKEAKAKIAGESIPIPKVIKLSKLKTDYKPFEAKRKLCDSYDMFLADRRIIPLLPKHLGKHFFKKKKIPVAVDLEHHNWKEQVERLCSSALLHLKTGTCSTVRVARSSMAPGDIVGNVVAAINGVAETVPQKWNNIRSLHLKLSDSVALPIYQSLPEANLNAVESASEGKTAAEGKKRGREEGDAVLSSRKSPRASSKKGRIHEVRYMDNQKAEEEVHQSEEVHQPKKPAKTKNDNQKAEEEVHPPKKSAKTKKGQEEAEVQPPKKSTKTKKGMNLKADGAVKKEADGAKKKRANKDELGETNGAKKKRANKDELGEADGAKKKRANKDELGEADGAKKKRAKKDELGEADGAKKKRAKKAELGEADGAKIKKADKVSKIPSDAKSGSAKKTRRS